MENRRWQHTQFLHYLTQMGATQQELLQAEQTIAEHEVVLNEQPFSAIAQHASESSNLHFQAWCKQNGIEHDELDEDGIDELMAEAISTSCQ